MKKRTCLPPPHRLALFTLFLFTLAGAAFAAPQVVSTDPADGENGVPVDTSVSAQFDGAVDPSSVSFSLTRPAKVTAVELSVDNVGVVLRDDGTPLAWGHKLLAQAINDYVESQATPSVDTGWSGWTTYRTETSLNGSPYSTYITELADYRRSIGEPVPAGYASHEQAIFWEVRECALSGCQIDLPYRGGGELGCETTETQVCRQSVSIVALNYNEAYGQWLGTEETLTEINTRQEDPATAAPAPRPLTAIATGADFALGLKADGTVVRWPEGYPGSPVVVPADLAGVVAIDAGFWAHLALKDDGTVVAWGSVDSYGILEVPADLSDVVAVSTMAYHALALRADGTVVAWGSNQDGQTDIPADLANVVAVSAGGFHSLALQDDGTVVAWGGNQYGQADVPADLAGVVAVSAGPHHSLVLKADGTVVGWGFKGLGSYGPIEVPPGLTNVVAIATGLHRNLALKDDGTVVFWGNNGVDQADVPVDTYISKVPAVGRCNPAKRLATATPMEALQFATTYTASASAADLTGGPMAGPEKWSFITETPTNVPPVADAGVSQSVTQGQIVTLDGSNSYDADGDYLYYHWQMAGDAEVGTASLGGASSPFATFIAAVPGEHQIKLVVNDGQADSTPAYTTILVVAYQDATLAALQATSEQIGQLAPLAFSSANAQKAYGNKLNATIKQVAKGNYDEAWRKLETDLLQKADGCLADGTPDKNDWLDYCADQSLVSATFLDTINRIAGAVNWNAALQEFVCQAESIGEVKMVFKDNMVAPAVGSIQCADNPTNPSVTPSVVFAPVNRPSLVVGGEVIFGDPEADALTQPAPVIIVPGGVCDPVLISSGAQTCQTGTTCGEDPISGLNYKCQ